MKITIAALIAALLGGLLYIKLNPSTENSTTASETVNEEHVSIPPELFSASAPGASVFILEPTDGAVVNSPFTVRFGVNNMDIVAAGIDQPNSGHHHLLINLDTLPNMHAPLPASDEVVHYGKGQTETELDLPPGEHNLQLLLGNYLHIPHVPPVISEKIQITVK